MITPTKAQKQEFLQNEADNYHTENVVLLANISGNSEYIRKAAEISDIHERNGSIPYSVQQERDELQRTLESLIDIRG